MALMLPADDGSAGTRLTWTGLKWLTCNWMSH